MARASQDITLEGTARATWSPPAKRRRSLEASRWLSWYLDSWPAASQLTRVKTCTRGSFLPRYMLIETAKPDGPNYEKLQVKGVQDNEARRCRLDLGDASARGHMHHLALPPPLATAGGMLRGDGYRFVARHDAEGQVDENAEGRAGHVPLPLSSLASTHGLHILNNEDHNGGQSADGCRGNPALALVEPGRAGGVR
ncbi:hypothetical protein CPLU01_06827 [Colletotrichum plurivorum]|uniref:Uncharacterized protein n=1 Tax=Colletotrichum plurivorum TaxID=2175906 RepID=A0A8H6KHQ2_9PEZI|nr:hypothetical protein CPLU01_06827 [Colletotrichum plurivorum]